MAFPPNQYRAPSGLAAIPPVVKNLLILNVLAFLAQNIPPLDFYLGVYGIMWPIGTPEEVDAFDFGLVQNPGFHIWQPLTSAFLHGGFGHLFFNLFALWMFGGVVEQTIGTKRFLWLYGIALLGSSALQLAFATIQLQTGGGLSASLGASGGVMGVLAAFAVLYPRQPIYLLFLPVPIQARWFVLGYVALDLLGGFGAFGSNIAHFAHLGGFIAGFLLLQYWRGRLPVRPSAPSL